MVEVITKTSPVWGGRVGWGQKLVDRISDMSASRMTTVVQYEEDLERVAEGGADQCLREAGESDRGRQRGRERKSVQRLRRMLIKLSCPR